MSNLGFLAALGAALAWGSYMVPFKKSCCSDLTQYQALMAIGIGLSGLVTAVILGYSFSLNIMGLVSGALWGIANAISLVAMANLGLSRAIPLLSSLVIISSFLWGALVFNELPKGIAVGLAGILLIVLGVAVISMTKQTASLNMKKGVLAGVVAGLIFGSQLVPIKVSQLATADFFFSLCLGIFLSGLLIALVKRVKFSRELIGFGLLSGVIWNTGNFLSLTSMSLIGLSKMGPISQSSILVAVFWGLFYFKEVSKPQAKIQILIGAIMLFAGIITLGFA